MVSNPQGLGLVSILILAALDNVLVSVGDVLTATLSLTHLTPVPSVVDDAFKASVDPISVQFLVK